MQLQQQHHRMAIDTCGDWLHACDGFKSMRGNGAATAVKRLGEGAVQVSTEVRKGDGTAGDGRIMLRGETETLDGLAELALTCGKHGHHGHPTNERLKAHRLKNRK